MKELSNKKNCPDSAQLLSCLSVLCDECDSTTLEHLECCDACRETLAELAGPQHAWLMVLESLSTSHAPDLSRLSHSVLALSDAQESGCLATADDSLAAHEIQQLRALMSAPSHPELLGRIARYEIEQLVGRGGMGLVFRGHDTELHRVVAVKTLGLHLVPMGAARERFIREARACAGLSHPHIVPMYDVITDGPIPALVMQYIAGPTLEDFIRAHGPLAWQQALNLAIQLADALSAAHAHGLVHRDIKPGNVMLEADASRALLLDFGLVRILDDATLTRSGILAGTPQFMSPEQARGDAVDERSDLFSLGSLIYYMVCGHSPFRGDQPMAILNRICHQAHRPMHNVQPEVPLELSQVVDHLLAKRAKHRVQSAREVRDRLTELARSPRRLLGSAHRRARQRAARTVVICSFVIAGLVWFGSVDPWRTSEPNQRSSQWESPTSTSAAQRTAPKSVANELSQSLSGKDGWVESSLADLAVHSGNVNTELMDAIRSLDHLESSLGRPVSFSLSISDTFELLRIDVSDLRNSVGQFERKLELRESEGDSR